MTLSQILAEIGSAKALLVGRDNPMKRLPDGYEYRAVPAHEWAEEAKLDPDEAALAWTLASEAPPIELYPQYSVAIAEAVCNAADGKDGVKDGFVVAKVTSDSRPMVRGHFGRQGGRWCSTFQRPSGKHLACARAVLKHHLAGGPPLVAKGATGWFDAHTQEAIRDKIRAQIAEAKSKKLTALAAKLERKLKANPPPEEIVIRWSRQGRAWVGPILDERGKMLIDPWRLMLDKQGKAPASASAALEALADGRRRWKMPLPA
jgi:hypothetical protein